MTDPNLSSTTATSLTIKAEALDLQTDSPKLCNVGLEPYIKCEEDLDLMSTEVLSAKIKQEPLNEDGDQMSYPQMYSDIPSEGSEDEFEFDDDNEGIVGLPNRNCDAFPFPTPLTNRMIFDGDSDGEEDVPLENMVWKDDVSSPRDWTGNFTEATGPSLELDDNEVKPNHCFKMFFDEKIITLIVQETNRYIESRSPGAKPTSNEEIRAFFGLNLAFGLKNYPSYRDAWSSNVVLHDQFISSVMTAKRFGFLLNHTHFNDNSKQPLRGEANYDKLYKIRPIITHLNDTFQAAYKPTRHQSVGESMIRFKGRSYMPMKPVKRGFKVWVRADQKGYVSQFEVYTGKNEGVIEKDLGTRVVKEMTQSAEGKNYIFFFDNFFSSVDLMAHMKRHGKNAVATIRSSRKNLPSFKDDKSMAKGEIITKVREDGVSVTKWMDYKAVHMISNCHPPGETSTSEVHLKDGDLEGKTMPTVVADYNQYMGGVASAEQKKSYYEIDRRSRRWYMRIFWHLLNVSVVNAHIIHNSIHGTMTLKSFIATLVEVLVGTSGKSKREGKVPAPPAKLKIPIEKRMSGRHHPVFSPTQRRCNRCSTRAEPHRTNWECSGCKVPLCLSAKRNCFSAFH